jgi:cytochrome b561
MVLVNTQRRYGAVAIALHWVMAVLIILLVALGIYMVQLPDAGFDQDKITLIFVHKEIGMVVLALIGLRLAWRQLNPLPRLEGNVPEWQQIAAVFVHLCLYALMVAQPILGWLMSSASGIPVDFLGLFTLPDLIRAEPDRFAQLRQIHDWLGLVMAGIICLHAGAALRHHFVQHDDTLKKMIGTARS